MSNDTRLSLFAGLLIGLGAYGFLSLGGIPGAVIFAFGLVGVVLIACAFLYLKFKSKFEERQMS